MDTLRSTTAWNDRDWAAWAIGLVEPLIGPCDRTATVQAMHAQAGAHPVRASVLLAGVLCDLAASLPPSDPWQAVDPNRFGTWRDGTDLVDVDVATIREDIGLAALARDLEPDAVRLLAGTSDGWSKLAPVVAALPDPVGSSTRAIAWLAWRRRAYLGAGETYPVLAAFLWLRRAEAAAAGRTVTDDEHYLDVRETARIPDEDYAELVSPARS
jgi:hypothetical protein